MACKQQQHLLYCCTACLNSSGPVAVMRTLFFCVLAISDSISAILQPDRSFVGSQGRNVSVANALQCYPEQENIGIGRLTGGG